MDEIKRIHLTLLTDISNHMDPESPECQNFVKLMESKIPKGLLSRSKTILDKLGSLETRGDLSPGNYETIKLIADESGNKDITKLISDAELRIRKLQGRSYHALFILTNLHPRVCCCSNA